MRSPLKKPKKGWIEADAVVEFISDTTTKGWVWLRIPEVKPNVLFTLPRRTVPKDAAKGTVYRVYCKPPGIEYTTVHITIPIEVIGDRVQYV